MAGTVVALVFYTLQRKDMYVHGMHIIPVVMDKDFLIFCASIYCSK